jgi:hypothetical protein
VSNETADPGGSQIRLGQNWLDAVASS